MVIKSNSKEIHIARNTSLIRRNKMTPGHLSLGQSRDMKHTITEEWQRGLTRSGWDDRCRRTGAGKMTASATSGPVVAKGRSSRRLVAPPLKAPGIFPRFKIFWLSTPQNFRKAHTEIFRFFGQIFTGWHQRGRGAGAKRRLVLSTWRRFPCRRSTSTSLVKLALSGQRYRYGYIHIQGVFF